ncbi:response regulator [Deinococcus pimensis]|uniref:response regulator n=1 Tax=Deinococcus pimensis TaxID=309888 RepID=UPI000481BE40|nr:response regulator [Deinococcus pimensis]
MTRVLVVDDELHLLDLVRMVLELRGYDVVTVPSGPEALERARTGAFDIALLDVVMNPWTGLETAERLRTLPGAPRIVFLTGLSDQDVMRRGLELGEAYLVKPFRAPELYDVIEQVLAPTP